MQHRTTAALRPLTASSDLVNGVVNRRSLLLSSAALMIGMPASAAGYQNQAEQKLADILAKKVKERELEYGFKLDADDIRELENVLRNKVTSLRLVP